VLCCFSAICALAPLQCRGLHGAAPPRALSYPATGDLRRRSSAVRHPGQGKAWPHLCVRPIPSPPPCLPPLIPLTAVMVPAEPSPPWFSGLSLERSQPPGRTRLCSFRKGRPGDALAQLRPALWPAAFTCSPQKLPGRIGCWGSFVTFFVPLGRSPVSGDKVARYCLTCLPVVGRRVRTRGPSPRFEKWFQTVRLIQSTTRSWGVVVTYAGHHRLGSRRRTRPSIRSNTHSCVSFGRGS